MYSAWPAFQYEGSASRPEGVCAAKNTATLSMSWSLSPAAMGCITGFLRVPVLKRRSCSAMYTAFWPARRGHTGFWLLPFGPWQEKQTAARVAPACTEPSAYGLGVTGAVAVVALPVGVAGPTAAGLELVVFAGGGAWSAAQRLHERTDNSAAEVVASRALFAIVSLFPRVSAVMRK